MAATMAFRRGEAEAGDEARWVDMPNPPYLSSYGDDDFVYLPDEAGLLAYVNGVEVVAGLQAIKPGDFVRIVRRGREETAYRFAGRCAATAEPGGGRRCAFTRMPIEGDAVRCRGCGGWVSAKVVEQIGACACGRALSADRQAPPPAEELL